MSDKLERLVFDQLLYTKAQAIAAVRNSAPTVLDADRKKQVYALLNGKVSQMEVAKQTKIPAATVNRYVVAFTKAGLVAPPSEYYGFSKALFTLDELGLPLAAAEEATEKDEKEE